MECLLVVVFSINGTAMTRSFTSMTDVPPQNIELVMAIEAGRAGSRSKSIVAINSDGKYDYGYDCGGGWVAKGLKRRDAF